MEIRNSCDSRIERHLLIITRILDTINTSNKRISLDIINYMRDFINQLVSEDKEVFFDIYASYCSIPYLKAIVKTLNELDQPLKIKVKITSIEDIMNIVEEYLTQKDAVGKYYLKSRTIIDLTAREETTLELVKISSRLLKKFEVINDFERITLV